MHLHKALLLSCSKLARVVQFTVQWPLEHNSSFALCIILPLATFGPLSHCMLLMYRMCMCDVSCSEFVRPAQLTVQWPPTTHHSDCIGSLILKSLTLDPSSLVVCLCHVMQRV